LLRRLGHSGLRTVVDHACDGWPREAILRATPGAETLHGALSGVDRSAGLAYLTSPGAALPSLRGACFMPPLRSASHVYMVIDARHDVAVDVDLGKVDGRTEHAGGARLGQRVGHGDLDEVACSAAGIRVVSAFQWRMSNGAGGFPCR